MKKFYNKITIGIIYSGRAKSFNNLLKSLLIYKEDHKIYIYNNTKEDISIYLKNFKYKEIFQTTSIAPPSEARSKIINECKSEYILLVDEDMILNKNCLNMFEKILDNNKNISIVGGLLREKFYFRPAIYKFVIAQLNNTNIIWRQSYHLKPLIKKNINFAFTDFVHPPFMINLSKNINNFDKNYKWGSELYDFFYNNYLKNIKTCITTDVVNYHLPEKYDIINFRSARLKHNLNGKKYFEKKWNIKIITSPYTFKSYFINSINNLIIRILLKIKK